MLISFARTLILYGIVVIVMRMMGKRQIGELQPYELAVAIMISELAALPMENSDVPLASGLIPILTLLFAQITLSYMALKSEKARAIICGRPTILIEKGVIQQEELVRSRINLNDLLEQLRVKDFPNIADVEFAILETNGQLSVIPKSYKRPIYPNDLKIHVPYEGLPTPVIIDGEIHKHNLERANISYEDLMKKLKENQITNFKDVLFASIDADGMIFIQRKQKVKL